jgi:hypothetical protein
LKAATIGSMHDWSPFSAASAAYCEMVAGFEVLCDCTFSIASTSSCGPPQYPMRQPVIEYALETPFIVTVRG